MTALWEAPRAVKAVAKAQKAKSPRAAAPKPVRDPLDVARAALEALDPEQRAILASEGWLKP